MSVYRNIKKELLNLGFEKTKERYCFKKPINDEFCSIVYFEKMNNFPATIAENYYENTYKPHCDIRIAVSRSECKLYSVNNIVNLWGKNERIAGYIKDEDTITIELIEDFKREFYNPLFEEPKIESIYDFMCMLEKKNHGFTAYNSYDMAYAAFLEERYEEAMFSIKAIFYQNMCGEEIKTLFPTERVYLLDKEFEDKITDDDIEKFKSRIMADWRWPNYIEVFELYNELLKIKAS